MLKIKHIKKLIEKMERNIENNMNMFEVLSRDRFIRDFCTLRIQLPKRCGNTRIAEKLYKWRNNVSVVLPNYELKLFFISRICSDEKVFSLYELQNSRNRGTSFSDMVIIDNTSLLSEEDVNLIYDLFSLSDRTVFVFLG